jgi:hypothetical protein
VVQENTKIEEGDDEVFIVFTFPDERIKSRGERRNEMNKKSLFAASLTAFLILSFLAIPTAPVKAWVYNDGRPSDTMFEKYGPRVDRLLVKLYPSATAEWAALEEGQIDIADALLTPTYLARYTTPPWNMTINVVSGGGGYKAVSRRYVGSTPGEEYYTGRFWEDIVNTDETYLGGPITVDIFWSTLNMHPEGCEVGDGQNMTIRVGSVKNLTSLNPIYCFPAGMYMWDPESEGLECAFASQWRGLCLVNPYNGSLVPNLVDYYEVGTYVHPIHGTCTKIKVVMTPDATWTDGTPLTMADVCFTFIDLPKELASKGYPLPSWYSNIKDVLDFKILDPYSFEILLDVNNSTLAPGILTNIILPKHVWMPIVLTGWGKTDPNVDGSGPWRFVAINDPGTLDGYPYGHAYRANSPGSIVTTNLPGSKPIKSPLGYFRLMPWKLHGHVTDPPGMAWSHKIPPELDYKNITIMGPVYDSRCDRYPQNVTVLANVTSPPYPTEQILNRTFLIPPAADAIDIDWSLTVSASARISYSLGKDAWWHRLTNNGFWQAYWNEYEIGYHYWCTYTVSGSVTVTLTIWLTLFGVRILTLYSRSWTLTAGMSGTLFDVSTTFNVWFFGRWGTQCVDNHFDPGFAAILYCTVKEDIAGSTLYDDIGWGNYTYKNELPSPDFVVDTSDLARASAGFGSYPGHPKWQAVADITGDYVIDIIDLAMISKKFGWHG